MQFAYKFSPKKRAILGKFTSKMKFAQKFARARGQFLKFPEGSGKFSKIFPRARSARGKFSKISSFPRDIWKLTKGEGKFLRQIHDKNPNFCQIQNYALPYSLFNIMKRAPIFVKFRIYSDIWCYLNWNIEVLVISEKY